MKKRAEYAQTFRVPANLWEALVQSAKSNLRSTNRELVWILREHFRGRVSEEVAPAEELNGDQEPTNGTHNGSRLDPALAVRSPGADSV